MDFPDFVFPSPVCPHNKKRELFAEYGTFNAANVNSEGKFEPQKKCTVVQSYRSSNIKRLIKHSAENAVQVDPFLQMRKKMISKLEYVHGKITNYKNVNKRVPYMSERFTQILKRMESWEKTGRTSEESPLVDLPSGIASLLANKEYLLTDTHIPVVNTLYTDGALCQQPIPGHQLLMLPSGAKQDKLSIHNVTSDTTVHVDKRITLEQDHGKIYQVSASPNKSGIGCLRMHSACSMFKTDCEKDSLHMDEKCLRSAMVVERKWDEHRPLCVCMSPYLAQECVVSLSDDSVLLWSANNSIDVIKKNHELRFPCKDDFRQCYFGSHPRLVVLSDPTGCVLLDSRIRESDCMDLFVLPNKHLHKYEQIYVSKAHPTKPFTHFVATNHGLMCVDERYPNHPMLHWQHMLIFPPQFIDVVNPSLGEEVILLGSQVEPEVMCFYLGQSGNSAPISTGVSSRLNVLPENTSITLTGLCGIANKQNNTYTVLQLTSLGDVFSQHIGPSHPDTDTKIRKEQVSVSDDEQEIPDDEVEKIIKQEPPGEKNMTVLDVFSGLRSQIYPHLMCSFCMPCQVQLTPDKEDEACAACGYQLKLSRHMKESIAEEKIINIPQKEDYHTWLPVNDMEKHKDPYSQILVKLWKGENEGMRDLHLQLDQQNKEKAQKVGKSKDNISVKSESNSENDNIKENQELEGDISDTGFDQREASLQSTSEKDSDNPDLAAVITQSVRCQDTCEAVSSDEMQSVKKHKRKRHSSESSLGSILSVALSSPGFLDGRTQSPRKHPTASERGNTPKFNFFNPPSSSGIVTVRSQRRPLDDSAKLPLSQSISSSQTPGRSPSKKKRKSTMGF